MEQEFEDYLRKKKIDPKAFQANEPDTFSSFKDQFFHIHPQSFTMQKLFLINMLRRKYHFQNAVAAPAGSEKAKTKPVVKRPSPAGKNESSKSAKPVVRPKALKPAVSTKDKSEQGSSPSESVAKPKMKPKMKPKVKPKTAEAEEKAKPSKAKPVIKKPVMKPKVKPPENKEEASEDKPAPKKKPVIKPRIPKKDT